MALFVMQDDIAGGGLTTLLDTQVLIRYMSKKSLSVLHTTEFDIRVPKEFHKDKDFIRGRILSANKLWRYRSDTIIRENCSQDQLDAIQELDSMLDNPHLILTTQLPRQHMLLLDNSRWFHGRTAIKDKNR